MTKTYTYICSNKQCNKEFTIKSTMKDLDNNKISTCDNCRSKVNQVFGNVGVTWNTPGAYGKSK